MQIKNKKKGFVSVSNLLPDLAQRYQLNHAYGKQEIIKIWPEVVSEFFEKVKESTQVVDFKKGILVIACLSKELAEALKYFAGKIIAALNKRLQTIRIKYIEVII